MANSAFHRDSSQPTRASRPVSSAESPMTSKAAASGFLSSNVRRIVVGSDFVRDGADAVDLDVGDVAAPQPINAPVSNRPKIAKTRCHGAANGIGLDAVAARGLVRLVETSCLLHRTATLTATAPCRGSSHQSRYARAPARCLYRTCRAALRLSWRRSCRTSGPSCRRLPCL